MKKILATNEEFAIQSGTGGVLKAPNVESGEDVIAKVSQVNDITKKIPKEASQENQLADKQWVLDSFGSGDYQDLENKPSVNDVELVGNKTSSDLGLASKEDAVLASTWKCKPSTYNDQQITISVQVNDGVTSLIPITESGIIGNAKPIVNGETQVTWVGGTEWEGTDNLVAKVSHYVLGNQDDKKLQPAGDYLTTEDFDQVEVSNFTAEKIDVREDGVIEMNLGSSIKVTKGIDEAKVVVVDGETEHKLRFPAKTGTFAVMEDVMDEVNGREVTWEDDLNYNDQASGFRVLKFKPRAFGMPSGRSITSITLTNSRSTATNAEVYIKLASADGQTIYATSDSQNMDTKNKAYTFTFDTIAGLDADTEYHMLFFLANSDPEAQQSVNLNLKSGGQSPDLYLGTRTDLRPKAVVVYKNPPLYAKPFSGIPQSHFPEFRRTT